MITPSRARAPFASAVRLAAVLAALGALVGPGGALAELPSVSDARVPQPPPGAPVAAGYLTLDNAADEDLFVTGASTPAATRVELHRSEIVDEVARMARQERLTVPAGGRLSLDPGGYHLMLMGLAGVLEPGETIIVTLATSAGPLEVAMPVVGPDARARSDHGGAMDAVEEPPAVIDAK